MAAIAYPYATRSHPRGRPTLRLVHGGLADAEPARVRRRGRLAPLLACVALVGAVWFGAGALRSADTPSPLATLPGAQVFGGVAHYVVRPGDTLWSIASQLVPGGDPRPIVDELASELHGAPLEAGMTLTLP
ncbi:MAG: LysM peptidoglycan-binding domain-containing protein [Actinomycetota bacterium]|nr:LysM peptidoglycan-binding domain-containing protein [Actinomycetota bacterium]